MATKIHNVKNLSKNDSFFAIFSDIKRFPFLR